MDEAILRTEMPDHSFFFLLNAETETHNVIHRSRDGQVGLIEPS